MFTSSLFPDYAVLEVGRNEAQAMRLAQQLHDVDIHVLATDADRRLVTARLRREGITDAMQLILLTEDEVMGWYNVGPVFLTILAQMRAEVIDHPERIVAEWHNCHRLLVLPDDFVQKNDESDFFGTLMPDVAEEETVFAVPSGTPSSSPLEGSGEVSEEVVLELERCIVAAVEMLERRWESGVVLRKFFLEALPVETIVSTCHLASSASLFRIVGKHFVEPLLKGYQVKGIQFSDNLLRSVKKLKKELLYQQADVLRCLERMTPMRFLHFLDLTLLQQTTTETFWSSDYIVRVGEVQRCRRTQRDLFSSLQLRVVWAKESVVRHGVRNANVNFLRVLLHTHPCIESDRKGYRLVPERLTYDCARIARIVYDAHAPQSFPDILAQYERRYMERPQTLSLGNVRTHFPQIHSVKRGVWEWQ